jgi:hypothetical protein
LCLEPSIREILPWVTLIMCDLRLALLCKRDRRSSGVLRIIYW